VPITDRELWARANQVLNHHGPDTDRFVADRITALVSAGDENGDKDLACRPERVGSLRDLGGAGKARR